MTLDVSLLMTAVAMFVVIKFQHIHVANWIS